MSLQAELKQLKAITLGLAMQAGTVRWVDSWAPAQNEGGMMVGLFHSRAEFPLVRVYQEQFHLLPDFIRDHIPATAEELPVKRATAERKGILQKCTPFQISRFRYDPDDPNGKWYFVGVVRIAKRRRDPEPPGEPELTAEERPSPAPAPTAVEKDWRQDAISCTDPLMFDTAYLKTPQAQCYDNFTSVRSVTGAREHICGAWPENPPAGYAAAVADALDEYVDGIQQEREKQRQDPTHKIQGSTIILRVQRAFKEQMGV